MKAKEVLHYYKGQWGKLMVENYEAGKCELTGEVLHQVLSDDRVSFILRLRPLPDMTEEELKEFCKLENKITIPSPAGISQWLFFTLAEFHYLLSHGFDLFNLIESGEAIKKEK